MSQNIFERGAFSTLTIGQKAKLIGQKLLMLAETPGMGWNVFRSVTEIGTSVQHGNMLGLAVGVLIGAAPAVRGVVDVVKVFAQTQPVIDGEQTRTDRVLRYIEMAGMALSAAGMFYDAGHEPIADFRERATIEMGDAAAGVFDILRFATDGFIQYQHANDIAES